MAKQRVTDWPRVETTIPKAVVSEIEKEARRRGLQRADIVREALMEKFPASVKVSEKSR